MRDLIVELKELRLHGMALAWTDLLEQVADVTLEASRWLIECLLRGGHYPDATSYWGNLQPAIAYAVEHGVSGAQAAYNRMSAAPNWGQLLGSFNTAPVWSVRLR